MMPVVQKTGVMAGFSEAYIYLMKRLYDPSCVPVMLGYSKEQEMLTELIRRCILYGESNSLLVCGPRGSGKSLLLRTALHNAFSREGTGVAFQVHLHGLLHTDDKIALEEITRQLHLENVVEDIVSGSFAERLQFLLDSLRAGSKESRPVVFVLDEFDLFANHKNQTLLYNLFDVSQSKQTPVCVIGLTCRLDVVELLEKRVKSRFSHRMIHMFQDQKYPELRAILSYYMLLPVDSHASSFARKWNERVESVLEDPTIKDILLFSFNISKDIHALKKFIALVLGKSCLTMDSLHLLESRTVLEALRLLDVDAKASTLKGLSVLELCLIISMKQLQQIYSDEPFNFQMVYDHYRKFCEQKSSVNAFNKAIAMKAFEHLIDLELINTVDNSISSSGLKEFRPMRLLVETHEVEEAVEQYVGCPSDIKQWATIDPVRN